MEPRYKTLQTIFNIVTQDPQPTTYKCRPREIILRQFEDWSVIQQHLKQVLSSQYNSDPIAILKAQSRLDIMMSCMSNQQVELLSKVMEEAAIRRQR